MMQGDVLEFQEQTSSVGMVAIDIGAGTTEACFRIPGGLVDEMTFTREDGIGTRLVAVYQGLRLADFPPSKNEGVPLPVTIRPLCRLSDELSTYAIFHADAAGRVCCWLKREGAQ